MIIVLKSAIAPSEKEALRAFLSDKGFSVREIVGEKETVLGAVGRVSIDLREVQVLPGVAQVIPISKPYKLASRELHKEDTVIGVGPVKIGGSRLVAIAGPCAVESKEQILESAWAVKDAGGVMLRGGAYKPRSSPYSFQGMGLEGLEYLKAAGEATGMPVVTEVVSPADVSDMVPLVDVFQIGTRNMQNFELLKAVGATGMPVILKRGMAATIEEWLMAAEYLLSSGTEDVILCERGIRTFETATRNTLDVSAIPVVRELSHLPVIVDPSHATGLRDKVPPMALASVAAGAHGLIIEVHPDPDKAFSDGPQSLWPGQFEKLMRDVEALCPTIGKELARLPERHQKEVLEAHLAGSAGGDGKPKVAFQGERGANSDRAIRHYFPEGEIDPVPLARFRDIFDSVLERRAAWGMVPIENSLAGSVFQNYDLLAQYPDVKIVGEIKIRIRHNLMAVPGATKETVRSVISHPQALSQCAEYLEREGYRALPYYDTAGAAAKVAREKDPSVAALAPPDSAEFYGLEVLDEGVETDPKNYTRFAVVAHADAPSPEDPDKATIQFSVPDEPGSLSRCLAVFNDRGINMTKLESRPILGKPWTYQFTVDVMLGEGGAAAFAEAEDAFRAVCEEYRNLGFYKSR